MEPMQEAMHERSGDDAGDREHRDAGKQRITAGENLAGES